MDFHNNPKVGTSPIAFYKEANWHIEGLGVSQGHGAGQWYSQDSHRIRVLF